MAFLTETRLPSSVQIQKTNFILSAETKVSPAATPFITARRGGAQPLRISHLGDSTDTRSTKCQNKAELTHCGHHFSPPQYTDSA